MAEPVSLTTADGESLAGELRIAPAAHAQVLLCHPHPQYGGSMRSLVTSELFAALPDQGITCVRFDFRGVGASSGCFGHGVGERHDVVAGLEFLRDHDDRLPTFLVGWSFGADVALSTRAEGHDGWVAIALPLRWLDDPVATGADRRPKLLLLAAHDEFRAPGEVLEATASWTATETEVIPGASHFFVGRTARLVQRVAEWVGDQVVGRRS